MARVVAVLLREPPVSNRRTDLAMEDDTVI